MTQAVKKMRSSWSQSHVHGTFCTSEISWEVDSRRKIHFRSESPSREAARNYANEEQRG